MNQLGELGAIEGVVWRVEVACIEHVGTVHASAHEHLRAGPCEDGSARASSSQPRPVLLPGAVPPHAAPSPHRRDLGLLCSLPKLLHHQRLAHGLGCLQQGMQRMSQPALPQSHYVGRPLCRLSHGWMHAHARAFTCIQACHVQYPGGNGPGGSSATHCAAYRLHLQSPCTN